MVQESGGPGEKQFFPAIEREHQAEAGDRGPREGSSETMKCEYCDKLDHLESSCPTRKTDRRTEVGMGCFFTVLLAPFYLVGMVGGFVWSAAKAGFEFGDGMWPQTWNAIRGKKDDAEQIPD